MTELEVQKIENRLITKKLKELTGVPKIIRKQLSRMSEDVLRIWNIDTVYSADIQLKIFRTVANSQLTLDALESFIQRKSNSKVKFERWLKRVVRHVDKEKRKELRRNGRGTRIKG